MARSLRRKNPTLSSQERFTDTPKIVVHKPDGDIVSSPGHPAAEFAEQSRPRPTSKAGIVLALLEAPEGATLAKLMQVTGWQAHTTRAALTGLRKRGWSVAIAKLPGADGLTVSAYRISARDAQ